MTNGKINNLLIPQVSKVGKGRAAEQTQKGKEVRNPDEFKNLLSEHIDTVKSEHGINLSYHAAKRLQERELPMDSFEYLKLREGIDKLKSKGGQDSLIITKNAAYIVDVNNDKIVTAMDKGKMGENVITKIDSTLIID